MRNHLIIAGLLGIILVYLLINATEEEPGVFNFSNSPLEQDYDYFISDVDSTHFALNGNAQYRIQAERMTHFPDTELNSDYTVIDAPDFMVYQQGELPWRITAESGTLSLDPETNEERLDLSDNVVIAQQQSDGKTISMFTSFLSVFPATQLARTDQDIQLISDDFRLNSTGMVADLNNNHVRFLNNGRGVYE